MKYLMLSLFLAITLNSTAQESAYKPGGIFLALKGSSAFTLPDAATTTNVVAWKEWPGIREVFDEFGVTKSFKPFRTPDPRLQCVYEICFEKAEYTNEFIAALENLPYIAYAERIPVYKTDFTPDDMNFLLWHLTTIDAEDAWDISTGDPAIKIAIVDDAVKITHQDLQSKIWTNPGETDGDSIDNDGNGYIDDIHGYDVADDDNDPTPPAGATNSVFSHGTHVSGIAGAATDNGTGIASIGFNCTIVPVKTKRDATIGSSELDNTYGGVDYAIAMGADVVNMSFGGMGYSSTYQTLITVGYDSGMVFCASAGNDGQMTQRFPAGYDHVISVASTDLGDAKSGFSNYFYSVDVSAPGNPIYSTVAGSNSSYGIMSGTSMSAPLTSGLCGLIFSVDPSLTPDEVEACLEFGCDNIDAQNQNYIGLLGAGRINAKNSLVCAQNPSMQIPNTSDFRFETWPNPVVDEIEMQFTAEFSGPAQIRLLDIHGKEIAMLYSGEMTPGNKHFRFHVPREITGPTIMSLDCGQVHARKLILKIN